MQTPREPRGGTGARGPVSPGPRLPPTAVCTKSVMSGRGWVRPSGAVGGRGALGMMEGARPVGLLQDRCPVASPRHAQVL